MQNLKVILYYFVLIDIGKDQIFGLKLLNQIAQKELSLDAQKLLQQRDFARKSGDFSQSDRLRNELEKLGVAVKDSKSGQSWDWIIN